MVSYNSYTLLHSNRGQSELEKQVLGVMGKNVWILSTLEKRLIEEGIQDFTSRFSLLNFLKKFPHLFCLTVLTDTFVWSKEQIEEQTQIQEQDEIKTPQEKIEGE